MQEQKERKYISGCSEAFSASDPGDDYVQQHADGQQPDCSGKEFEYCWVGGLIFINLIFSFQRSAQYLHHELPVRLAHRYQLTISVTYIQLVMYIAFFVAELLVSLFI